MMEVHWSLELYTNKCVKQFSIIHMYIPSSVTATDTDASPPCVSRIRKVYVGKSTIYTQETLITTGTLLSLNDQQWIMDLT